MESIRPGFLRGLTWGSLRFEWSKAKLSGRRRPRKKVVPQLAGNGSQCQQVNDKECKFEKIRDFAWKKICLRYFFEYFWIKNPGVCRRFLIYDEGLLFIHRVCGMLFHLPLSPEVSHWNLPNKWDESKTENLPAEDLEYFVLLLSSFEGKDFGRLILVKT